MHAKFCSDQPSTCRVKYISLGFNTKTRKYQSFPAIYSDLNEFDLIGQFVTYLNFCMYWLSCECARQSYVREQTENDRNELYRCQFTGLSSSVHVGPKNKNCKWK